MTDNNQATAEFSISRPDGTYTSYSATRSNEREAIADLWRMIAHAVKHATGTARNPINVKDPR